MKLEQIYEQKLDSYVSAYLLQKEAMDDSTDADAMTKAVKMYIKASKELLDFKKEAFSQDDPQLPPLEVFFDAEEGYHDFARRFFLATMKAKSYPKESQWDLFEKVYVGGLLKEYFTGGK